MLAKLVTVLIPGLVTLAILFGGWGLSRLLSRSASPPVQPSPPAPSAFALPSPEGSVPRPGPLPPARLSPDTDGDDLSDELEAAFGSDPTNPDTDGDGYRDGHEVANGHDPTKPSPGDTLTSPLPAPLASPNFTQQFLAKTGEQTPDTRALLQRTDVRTFAEEESARLAPPAVPETSLNVVEGSGKGVVSRYLDAVSTPQNPRIVPVQVEEISDAFSTLTKDKNEEPLRALLGTLDTNVTELKKAPVPREALALHQQYVGAALALQESTEALLNFQRDAVGALVAASRIESLRTVFQTVLDGIKALEKKYGIT